MFNVWDIYHEIDESLCRDGIRVRSFRGYWIVEQWFVHDKKWKRFSRFINASDAYRQALALQRNYLRELGTNDFFELDEIEPVIETKPPKVA